MKGIKMMGRDISKYSKIELNFLQAIKRMPPLYHKLPGEEFDINKSETVAWIMNQPETKQFVCEKAMNRSKRLKPIEYNPETGKWQGVDYEEDD